MKKTFIVATLSSVLAFSQAPAFGKQNHMLDSAKPASERLLPIRAAKSTNRIADEYVVIFNSNTSDDEIATIANDIFRNNSGNKLTYFRHFKGFSGKINAEQLKQLQANPQVETIEANQSIVYIEPEMPESAENRLITNVDSWALDRIDQRNLPLDTVYDAPGHGSGVHAYILSTGIYTEHNAFAGRASNDYTAAGISEGSGDLNGQGTQLAAVIGSDNWGVARETQLHGVKVLDSSGTGTLANLIAGIDYVTANHQHPAVATIGVFTNFSQTLNDAIQASIDAGVVWAVPSGDYRKDACNYSPGSLTDAITVSSTSQYDTISGASNRGSCVDLYAPGLYVKSAWHTGPNVNNTISHSPVSAALTAGVAAMMRGFDETCTPAQVKQKILNKAKANVLTDVPNGTANLYLSVEYGDLGGCEGDDPTSDGSLIAIYPFNGNANDASGNGYHGSVSGAQMTNDRFGRVNSAYFFNGNDRIVVNGLSGYNWGANFTASVWFRRTGNFGTYQGILSNGYYSSGSWEMRMGRESSGQKLVYLVTGPVQGGETRNATGHQWHHAVLTFDGSRVTGYLDNTVVVSFARTTPTPIRNNPIFIGHPGTVGGEYFYGVIDDVRLYNRALSAEEVAELYNATQGDSAVIGN